MDIRLYGVFWVEHFRNTTVHPAIRLERVRSPEGSSETFQAGRRFFSESALRHLHSHHLSLSLSLPFFSSCLVPSPTLPFLPFTIPLFNLQTTARAARRDAAGSTPKTDSGIERIGSRIFQVIFPPRAIPRFERTPLPTALNGFPWKLHLLACTFSSTCTAPVLCIRSHTFLDKESASRILL